MMSSKFEKRVWKRFRSGWVICVAAVAAVGCSLSPSNEKVTIEIGVGGGPRISGFSHAALTGLADGEDYVHDPADPHSPPPDVDSFNCFMVNVSGPGIGYFNEGGSGGESNGCGYPGVVSTLFTSSTKVIELEVPAGRDRRIQVIGLKVAGGKCPTSESFARLSGYRTSDHTSLIDHRPYLLGETKTDLLSDTSVEVKNAYHSTSDWSKLDPFYCPYRDPNGSSGFDTDTVQGLAFWLSSSSLPTAEGTLIDPWPDLSGNGIDAYSATAPVVSLSNGSSHPMASFGVNDHMIVPASSALDGQDHTVFAVIRTPPGVAGVQKVIYSSDDSVLGGGSVLLTHRTDVGNNAFIEFSSKDIGYEQFAVSGGISNAGGDFLLLTGIRDVAFGLALRVNGTEVMQSAMTLGNLGYHMGGNIGSDNALVEGFDGGMIGEILVYPRLLSSGEQQTVECYLGAKWEIGVSHSCP